MAGDGIALAGIRLGAAQDSVEMTAHVCKRFRFCYGTVHTALHLLQCVFGHSLACGVVRDESCPDVRLECLAYHYCCLCFFTAIFVTVILNGLPPSHKS